jgi:hypothetical protein
MLLPKSTNRVKGFIALILKPALPRIRSAEGSDREGQIRK